MYERANYFHLLKRAVVGVMEEGPIASRMSDPFAVDRPATKHTIIFYPGMV
jgi:hypothetical protein